MTICQNDRLEPVVKTRVSVAEAKAQFSELVNRVVHRGERFVITRHGKPVVALVGVEDLHNLEERARQADSDVFELPPSISEEDYVAFEESIQQVIRERQRPDWSRPAELEDTILPFDELAAEAYARVRAELERQGSPLALADLMIASVALVHDLTVVTGNVSHFARVRGLAVENWLQP